MIKKLLLGIAVVSTSAYAAPCGAPGRLCAPIQSLTSAQGGGQPAPQAPPPAARPTTGEPETAEMQTFAVPMPGEEQPPAMTQVVPQGEKPPVRIGLLLPLRSEALGRAADALRAGFMAAWERDRSGFDVTVVETGDTVPEVLTAYATAQEQQDMIVGPLARSAVTALATSAAISKPTIALNHPDGRNDMRLPPQMLVIGLSIEDEAQQLADWAGRDHPRAKALVISGNSAWQKRIAAAIAARWQRLGMQARVQELGNVNGYLVDAELVALRARLQNDAAEVLFAALDPDQARQLRVALSAPPLNELPLYGTSSLNPGRNLLQPGPELDGVHLIDMPWQLQRDHPAVMVYPQPVPRDEARLSADMERLYALGIDAFRVAREIALRPGRRFQMDGVTGQLTIDFGQGPSWFERVELPAVYKNGVPVPVKP